MIEAPTRAPPGEKPEFSDQEKLGRLAYLVVDDDADSRLLIKKYLQIFGVSNVIEAESAGHALALIAAHKIDVLIADLMMPDIAGDEFVWCLRRNHDDRLRRLPVVMVSAYAEEEHRDRARDAGVDEFVSKPCSMGDFHLHVRRAMVEPRSFVVAPDYLGPDRRRKDKGAPAGHERRSAAANPAAH